VRNIRGCFALVATLIAVAGVGTADGATINGIGDTRIQFWSAGAQTYANALGSTFAYARTTVAWDVGRRSASDPLWISTDAWIRRVVALGKTPIVSFDHLPKREQCMTSNSVVANVPCLQPDPPSANDLKQAILSFRSTWPQVTQFTAWNEPNHSVAATEWDGSRFVTAQLNPVNDANLAADYFKALTEVCAGGGCIAVAGDFSDGTASMGPYPSDYKARLTSNGITPSRWAVHAYSAVNSATPTWIDDFVRTVSGSSPVWITEVGVKVCDASLSYVSDTNQRAAAQRLLDLMTRYQSTLQRTYYYHLVGNAEPATCTTGGTWDSGVLFEHPSAPQLGSQPRPALDILFPTLDKLYWTIRNQNSGGAADQGFTFGRQGSNLVGDWNNDGVDTPGAFRAGNIGWYLRNSLTSGMEDVYFTYGFSTGRPLVGDWNGDGIDTVALFEPTGIGWYLRNSNSGGTEDVFFRYGFSNGIPLAGDWNGDGIDTVGLYNPSNGGWYLKNSNSQGTGNADVFFTYGGGAGDIPLAGDWNGDGIDTPAVYNPSTAHWYLKNSNSQGTGLSDVDFLYGNPGDTPAVADWNGDGVDTPGVVR
jgi:hypothetical protein